MRRLDRVLTGIENALAAGSLAAAALVAIAAVVSRYLFNHIFFWSEELTILLVIFSTFFGAVVTLRHHEHVNVDILPALLRRLRRPFAVLAGLITIVYCGLIGLFAWLMVIDPVAHNTITPALKVPLWVVEIPLPVGLTLMFLRAVEMTWRITRGGGLPGHPPGALPDGGAGAGEGGGR